MRFTFITIFPGLIEDFCKEGLLAKAVRTRKIKVETINPRDFTADPHRTVDDLPYGGGQAGMIMKVEPLVAAIRKAVGSKKSKDTLVILLSPSKKVWQQKLAIQFAKRYQHIVFVCGRYEGVDARVEKYIDAKISIGEFVLMGGEVAGLAVLESIARLLPGVIGNEPSLTDESYGQKFHLEYPQYTRPEVFEGNKVPKVLLSGHHQKIELWRKQHSAPVIPDRIAKGKPGSGIQKEK
ncbi:MAG: tRNA (guanosine(37)-N1)-methyltransferase TrmD [Patescibacteria group bacterium]|jgi:tRNA (guanine37-N1)-methyltransferase